MHTKKIFMLIGMATALAACAGTDNDIIVERPLSEIYESAYAEFNDEEYEAAATEFLQAETQYPASQWAADALVMAAYSQYMDDDFAGAIMTIDRFMRFHPGHRDVPYMLYLRGMCYYRQVSDVRREPGMSAYALQQFQQLVTRFPKSEYAKYLEKLYRGQSHVFCTWRHGTQKLAQRNFTAAIGCANSPRNRHDARGFVQINRMLYRNRVA